MSDKDVQKIVITIDGEGNAEIRSPVDMDDDEVLEILSAAVDATAEKVLGENEIETAKEDKLQRPAVTKKTYLN
jgi:hypothetical protein